MLRAAPAARRVRCAPSRSAVVRSRCAPLRPVARPSLAPRRAYSTAADPASGTNGAYLEELYDAWRANSASVGPSWAAYFGALTTEYASSPSAAGALPAGGLGSADLQSIIRDHAKVITLIRSYQVRGHHLARLDPLELGGGPTAPPECDPKYYGFTEADMERRFFIGTGALQGFLGQGGGVLSLRELVAKLQATYCGHIGIEYMHIANRDQCDWIRSHVEVERKALPAEKKAQLLEQLAVATRFEAFLAVKEGKGEKRFGLEGCEALIPGLKTLIDTGVQRGLRHVVIGMPHRGRLNVLANVLHKPVESIFAEFKGFSGQDFGSGDVKYHLGLSVEAPTLSGKSVHLSLVANPSHLEAVNPVVEGKTRAKQFYLRDQERSQVMSVLLHGDAAFSGQGVVYETMGFSDLHDYTTGGTVHIIVNNQIGFTADPRHCRSSPYCSDLAKAIQAPIFHVNSDYPEAVVHVMSLAAQWRQQFKKDVVVDMICYRRHGHNEGDEPLFTQPLMYKKIAKHATTLDLYQAQLLQEGSVDQLSVDKLYDKINASLEEAHAKSKKVPSKTSEWLQAGEWGKLLTSNTGSLASTGIALATAKQIGVAVSKYPADHTPHPTLVRTLQQRIKTVEEGKGIDWATAEAMAFGSLLNEGFHVRLSGQDVERGTFSQRHAVLVDQNTGKRYYPLNNIRPGQAQFSVSNSSLSEFGVLGFELGYSMENPQSLVMWEAQFGDFVNGAQVIIDQFISSMEVKWMRQTGLTMLLPHGFEGQGPEHSSARPERFLQLTDEDEGTFQASYSDQLKKINMLVACPSLPANYFHLLRAQLARPHRKPLVVMTPKSLLRLKEPLGGCTSTLDDFGPNSALRPVIGEVHKLDVPDAKVRKVVLCTGKVYFDLLGRRLGMEKNKDGVTSYPKVPPPQDVAIVRLELLAPFPFAEVAKQLAKYPNAQVVWAQEEPKNMGWWTFVAPRIRTTLSHAKDSRSVAYAGRASAASPATGFKKVHEAEVEALLKEAFK